MNRRMAVFPMRSGSTKKSFSASWAAVTEMSGFLARPWATAAGFAGILMLRSITPVAAALFMRGSLDSMAGGDYSSFIMSSLCYVAAYALDAISTTVGTYRRVNILESVAAATRKRFVQKAMAMPFDKYEKLSKGDLVSRVTADINESSRVFSAVYFVFEVVVRAAAAIALLMYMSWNLGFTVLGAITLSILVNSRLNRPLAGLSREYQGLLGRVSAYALNAIEGHMVVKAFRAEGEMNSAFSQKVKEARDRAMTLARHVSYVILGAFGGAFGTLLAAFGYGAYLAIAGRITFGSMLASFSATDYISPLGHLGERLSELHKSVGAYARIKEVMEVEEDSDLAVEQVAGEGSGSSEPGTEAVIVVRDLSYEYLPGVKALDSVSFEVRRGQKVAIVGRSGCGKSTLMKVLAGLYRPEPGTTFVNGLDMAYWRLAKASRDVTYVPQEPFLFAGSVSDNLALGLPGGKVDAKDMAPEVRKGLELGDAFGFVASSKEGLASQVGERGSLLSGGQRQRLCLARGFLRNTPVLLLDEPTSSVDKEAEARILSGISSQRDLTCLIVTHRFDVAGAADLILVMDGGRVVEAGPHEELLENGGLYRSLFTGEVRLSSSPSPEVGGAS